MRSVPTTVPLIWPALSETVGMVPMMSSMTLRRPSLSKSKKGSIWAGVAPGGKDWAAKVS